MPCFHIVGSMLLWLLGEKSGDGSGTLPGLGRKWRKDEENSRLLDFLDVKRFDHWLTSSAWISAWLIRTSSSFNRVGINSEEGKEGEEEYI